jgi:hypothetical protein
MPLDQFRISVAERLWPGPAALGIAYPLRFPERPKLKLNEFFYPTHASRWGEFNGVMDQAGYDIIMETCFPDDGTTNPTTATFTLSQVNLANGLETTVETEMFCLPPKPLVLPDQKAGLYLITLVDQRYFLQWTTAGKLDTGTSWDGLLTAVASRLNIDMSLDSGGNYGNPHPDSDLYSPYINGALLLDAIAWNTGRVIVRQWDGTYYAQNYSTAAGLVGDPDRLSGGDFTADLTTDNSKNLSPNAILPEKVTVTFPFYVDCMGYKTSPTPHVPFALTAADVYKVDVMLTDVFPDSEYTGFQGAKVFHDTAPAFLTLPTDTMPYNDSNLQTLARQIATDFYNWQTTGLEEVAVSIFDAQPEGIHDLYFLWDRDHCLTRIQRKPLNFMCEEFQHYFTPNHAFDGNNIINVQVTGGTDAAGYSWVQTFLAPTGGNMWVTTGGLNGSANLWRLPSNNSFSALPSIPAGQCTIAWRSKTRPCSWECPPWGGVLTASFTDTFLTNVTALCTGGNIMTLLTSTTRTVRAWGRDFMLTSF